MAPCRCAEKRHSFDFDRSRDDLNRLGMARAARDFDRSSGELEVFLQCLEIVRRRLAVLANDQEAFFQIPLAAAPAKLLKQRLGRLRQGLLRLSALAHSESFSAEGIAP